MAADKTIEIKINTNVDTTQSVKNITDLKKAISDLEKESNNLDFGSDEFEKSKEQIDELKEKLESLSKSQTKLDEELNAKAAEHAAKRAEQMEKIGNNLAKFAAGVTDAFAGAFIAFGAGEEDAKKFNETLQKGVGVAVGVKGAIEAVVAGVQLAGPAFEAFNAVIKANPIAAVVVAVAALTAGIYLLVKAINAEESESEKLTKQLEKQKVAAEQLSKARQSEISVMESRIGLMKAQGKSDSEILQATKELYDAKRKVLEQDLVQLELAASISKAKLQEVLANESLTESYYKTSAALARSLGQEKEAKILENAAKQEKIKNSKEITDQLLKDLTAVKELKDKIAVLDIQKETEVAGIKNTINEKNKKIAEENRKLKEEEFKRERERIEQEYKEQLDDLKKYEEEQRKIIVQGREESIDDDDKYYADKHQKMIKDAEDALVGDKDNLSKKRALLEAHRQEEIRIARLTGKDITAINKKYAELDEELVDEAFKKKIEKINKYTQAIGGALNSVMGVFKAISDLQKQEAEQDSKERQEKLEADLSALSEAKDLELAKEGLTQDEKIKIQEKYAQQEYELKLAAYNADTAIKKKAFEQDKKMKIAQTVITTITGAMSALTGMISSIPGPVGIILGALSAAAVVATVLFK